MSSRRLWTWSAGALVLVVAGSGCASSSSGDAWVYAASRDCYFGSDDPSELLLDVLRNEPSYVALGIAVTVIALPFAFDTVALPITIPHDVHCVVRDETQAVFGSAPRSEDAERGDARPAKKRIRDIWAEADEND